MAKRPDSYNMLVEIIGEKSAKNLCACFGGGRLYVPKAESAETARRCRNRQMLAEAIGETDTLKLCSFFSGEFLYIPKIDTLEAADRIEKIMTEADRHSTKELARKYGLTDTRIRQIIKDKNKRS